jgi:DNA-binding response OmpR family regulator
MSVKNILLVDDEEAISDTIIAYAIKENIQVDYSSTGEAGLEKFQNKNYDLVLIDWMLPNLSGPDLIKKIRQNSDVPIIMISARNDETDIVLGLEFGADDYITKPFGPRELIARINALLRRSNGGLNAAEEFKFADLTVNFDRKELSKNGNLIKITPTEFRILGELINNKNKVVKREDLMMKALGYNDFLQDRTLDTHIKNLRKKLEFDPKNPALIQTVREAGFILNTTTV